MSDIKKRARTYFRLAEQYTATATLSFKTLIAGGNSNAGCGNTMEEAESKMAENSAKSDLYLFIPAIFCCLQSTELYIKGLLLLNEIETDDTHEIQKLLEKLREKYNTKSSIYKAFCKIYYSEQEILKNYRVINKISNTQELYISLRYPESTTGKQYEYYPLMCNGDNGVKLFKKLNDLIIDIKHQVWIEYNNLYNESGAS